MLLHPGDHEIHSCESFRLLFFRHHRKGRASWPLKIAFGLDTIALFRFLGSLHSHLRNSMMRYNMRNLILLAGAVVFLNAGPAPAGVTLVRIGKPNAVIVVSKAALTASPDLKPDKIHDVPAVASKVAAAARDLQVYVEKITGAKLPIIGDDKEPAGNVIMVGRSALSKAFDAKIPAGLTPARAEEGFIIMCQGNRLLLAGNDEEIYRGTQYAVAELLHRFGVRWFMPTESVRVVPKEPTTELPDMAIHQ